MIYSEINAYFCSQIIVIKTKKAINIETNIIKINMDLIVTTKEDLLMMVRQAVKENISLLNIQKEKVQKENLSLNEAVVFLENIGLKMSKSAIYKLTSTNKIACKRFGRRVIFNRADLLIYAESRLHSNHTDSVALSVVESIARKEKKQ
jgi:hypothetical protein